MDESCCLSKSPSTLQSDIRRPALWRLNMGTNVTIGLEMDHYYGPGNGRKWNWMTKKKQGIYSQTPGAVAQINNTVNEIRSSAMFDNSSIYSEMYCSNCSFILENLLINFIVNGVFGNYNPGTTETNGVSGSFIHSFILRTSARVSPVVLCQKCLTFNS